VVDPDLPNTLYAATDIGVFATNNGGGSWSPLGSGLPLVPVLAIKLHRPSRILRAATHGRSMWDLSVPTSGLALGPSVISLAPPFTPAGTAAFSLVVNGANFQATSVVRWNGSDRSTTFVNDSQLSAKLTATDLNLLGVAQVSIYTPGYGETSDVTFAVTPAIPAYAHTLSASAGQYQNAAPGSLLPIALTVRATDSLGKSKAGLPVTFAATNGGGQVNPSSAVTDANGLASTKLTLGSAAGLNVVNATSPGAQPVGFLEGANNPDCRSITSSTRPRATIKPRLQARCCRFP